MSSVAVVAEDADAAEVVVFRGGGAGHGLSPGVV